MAPFVSELQFVGNRDKVDSGMRKSDSDHECTSDSDCESKSSVASATNKETIEGNDLLDAASEVRAGQPGAYAAFCKMLASR
jgi:hypothetical protein